MTWLLGLLIQRPEESTEIVDTEHTYNSYKDYLKKTGQTHRWTGDFKEFGKRLKTLLNSGTDLSDGFSSRRDGTIYQVRLFGY